MTLLLLAGQPAGLLALLTCQAQGHRLADVVAYDNIVGGAYRIAPAARWHRRLPIDAPASDRPDLLVSVHGRQIVPDELLNRCRLGGINLHPCLSRYPGKDPIGRLLADGGTEASVGAHRMTSVVDGGPVLVEEWTDVMGCTTRAEVYARLYPLYVRVLVEALAAA